jgi:hypothetical protein
MIYAVVTGKKDQDIYIRSAALALNAKIAQIGKFVNIQPRFRDKPTKARIIIPHDCKGVILAGLLRGNAPLLREIIKRKIDFYYVDHAYFHSGYKYPHWMRVTKNGFVQNSLLNVDQNRLRDRFGDVKFQPYDYRDKTDIVVIPPSNTVGRFFRQEDWETRTVEKIRQFTDRPIVVRKKEVEPVLDNMMTRMESKIQNKYTETLDEVLSKAYCVVSFNSTVALTALQRGIPVICERFCPAFPLSHSYEQIEDLQELERAPLFSSLAWGQYTLSEAASKTTFDFINQNKQWEGSIA